MSGLICIAGGKGSPGATTLALALALSDPEPVTLVDADPDGGDLAAWLGLSATPGFVSLANFSSNGRVVPRPSAALVPSNMQVPG